jgi:uncharacterized membrane protein
MSRGRLEAFSDGVIAIIITIMVLELRPPAEAGLEQLRALLPDFLAYVLSFVFVGIYWSNHHHMLHAVTRVSGGVLWANLHLLFWLSMVPFVTAWLGHKPWEPVPVAAYGLVLLMDAVAYTILERALIAIHGEHSKLREAVGHDTKGKVSLAAYVIAVPMAFVHPGVSYTVYVLVALSWLVPDRRIERHLDRPDTPHVGTGAA